MVPTGAGVVTGQVTCGAGRLGLIVDTGQVTCGAGSEGFMVDTTHGLVPWFTAGVFTIKTVATGAGVLTVSATAEAIVTGCADGNVTI